MGFWPDRSSRPQSEFTGAAGKRRYPMVVPSVLKFEIQQGAEHITFISRECPGIIIYILQEIHIDNTYRTSAGSLGGKMIDNRDLDIVNIETIFDRGSSPDDNIIPEPGGYTGPGKGLYYFGDIPVAAGVTLYFIYPDRFGT